MATAHAVFAARVAHFSACRIAVLSIRPRPCLHMPCTGLLHIENACCRVESPADAQRTFRCVSTAYQRHQPSLYVTKAPALSVSLPALDQYRLSVSSGSFALKALPAISHQPVATSCFVNGAGKQLAPTGTHCDTPLGFLQYCGVRSRAWSPCATRALSSKVAATRTNNIVAPLDEAAPKAGSKPVKLDATKSTADASDRDFKGVAATDLGKTSDIRGANQQQQQQQRQQKQQQQADDSTSGELRLVSTSNPNSHMA